MSDWEIDPIAKAFHAAWGKAAPWGTLSQGMKWRYRKAAERLVVELQKSGMAITNGHRGGEHG